MQNFVSVILNTKELDEHAVVEAMLQSLGAPLAERETEYGLFESENQSIVLRLQTPYELDDEESDAFAQAFAERMFEMGYDDFEIETSLEEALDAKLNAAIKAINSMGSMWKKVKQGSVNSAEVKTIQQALNQLGFKAGKADGWFGKKTANAVRAFQKSKGLTVDGDPGPITLKAMLNAVLTPRLDKKGETPKGKTTPKGDMITKPGNKTDKLDGKDGEIRNPGYKKDMADIAAYKVVTGSGQGRRYKVFDKDGNEIANGRGPGPTNVPTKDEYDAKNTSNNPSVTTDIGGGFGSSMPGMEEPPVAIADFSKVETPDDSVKIAKDAIEKAREDGNLQQIAQIASASLANMPNIQTPAEKAEVAKKVIAQIDDSELSNPAVLAALAPAQLAVDVVDAGTDETKLQAALEKFTVDVFPEAIPAPIRSKVPPEEVAERSAEVIIKKAQEEGLMSQFEDPSKAVAIIQAQVEELSKADDKEDGTPSSRLDKKGETPAPSIDVLKKQWTEIQKSDDADEITAFVKKLSAEQKRELKIDPLATTAADLGLPKEDPDAADPRNDSDDTGARGEKPEEGPDVDDLSQELRGAMKGIGTTEEEIEAALGALTSEEDWEDLQKAFKDEYDRDLISDLRSELNRRDFKKYVQDVLTKLDIEVMYREPRDESISYGMFEETYDDDDEFYEMYGEIGLPDDELWEAEYRGRKVKLNKPMRGDVKKFKVYVKNKKGNVIKVNFGDPNSKIKKSNPARRRSFRARHNCDNPGPKTKARYWSCRKW